MAVQYIWKIHSIEQVPAFYDPPTNSDPGVPLDTRNATIAAITSVGMPVQANVTREVQAGDVFATSGRIEFSSVDLTFTSNMAEALLDMVGVQGACIAPGGDSYNVYVARYECNGPSAGAVHRRYTITKGLFFLQNMSVDHQGDLSVSAQLRAVYDGTNDPVTVTNNVALPSAAQIGDMTGRWTLTADASDNTIGSTSGVPVYRKRSLNVDFGVNASTQGADSDSFDSFASIDSVLPIVTVTGIDPNWFDDLGLTINGKAVAHAYTLFSFRKRDGAGGFVSDATAAHIKMTAAGPAYYDQLLSANATDAATMSFRIEAIEDGAGNAPLLITTGQTL